ncbi:hypothetical protein KPATCC21470_7566 [Kitasatospora purpeofusca]
MAFATPTTEREQKVAQRTAHDPSLYTPNGPPTTRRSTW